MRRETVPISLDVAAIVFCGGHANKKTSPTINFWHRGPQHNQVISDLGQEANVLVREQGITL